MTTTTVVFVGNGGGDVKYGKRPKHIDESSDFKVWWDDRPCGENEITSYTFSKVIAGDEEFDTDYDEQIHPDEKFDWDHVTIYSTTMKCPFKLDSIMSLSNIDSWLFKELNPYGFTDKTINFFAERVGMSCGFNVKNAWPRALILRNGAMKTLLEIRNYRETVDNEEESESDDEEDDNDKGDEDDEGDDDKGESE